MSRVTPAFVSELIDFAPTAMARGLGFADQQLDGTTATFNMLERHRCAYLADEVGMGKTYVALGVMALTRYLTPAARIVVIAPRENIQWKWIKELRNFVRLNWRVTGNRVKSWQGQPAWEPFYCRSLGVLAKEMLLDADRDFFLRLPSFSLALKQVERRRRYRADLLAEVPWLPPGLRSARTPDGFRDAYGRALNAVLPEIDLLVVDEAHNLKHGFGPRVSTRNRILGLAFGHPDGRSDELPQYGPKVRRVLLLSATPFEDDYAAIGRQFDLFGHGDAAIGMPHGTTPRRLRELMDPAVADDDKRDLVGRLMIRRVSALRIGDARHTKNMYRREWRQGGYHVHDEPIRVVDPTQRLVVALIQKKIAELLQHERFNHSFQIGMLSSFESFLETVGSRQPRRRPDDSSSGDDGRNVTFDGNQGENEDERRGIDTDAVAAIVDSYRTRFHAPLPHPKLDATADAFASMVDSGDKVLIFVRRVRTVDELGARLDAHADRWLRHRMASALPDLTGEIDGLFAQYAEERARRPEERAAADTQLEDDGGHETFFAWFFRGAGPPGVLSGAALQQNRLSNPGSVYATFFEDDHVSWLLGRPGDAMAALARVTGRSPGDLAETLRARAYRVFHQRTARQRGYPRLHVFSAYQHAGLELIEQAGGQTGRRARTILDERYPDARNDTRDAPSGFPPPQDAIGITSFITELVKVPALRQRIWPDEPSDDFRERFRRREQRRELLSAVARLGAAYIDLYLLAIGQLGSFSFRRETGSGGRVSELARAFVARLASQSSQPGFHACYELSQVAEHFDLLLGVNFPVVPSAPLEELALKFGRALQGQVPIGRMAGGVNQRLVTQFRMPGFPLAMVSTDVLQEGEDLHTFCRRIVHYGITWTPSAMEQRTGRIDRIGSLTQRRLDGRPDAPPPGELLQVYYPHLQDTIEVLQVRRVLRRLNRFLALIHERTGDAPEMTSRIDAAREMLEELDVEPPPTGELRSAFPIHRAWLEGRLHPDDVVRPDLAAYLAHLGRLWTGLQERYHLRILPPANDRMRHGFALVRGHRLLHPRAHERGVEQPFTLELRSQAAGDATLLHCRSAIGRMDLEHDKQRLDDLYTSQQVCGMPKVCVRPASDDVSVESDIIFHPDTTRPDELVALVGRTVVAAATLARRPRVRSAPVTRPAWRDATELLPRVDQLVEQRGGRWRREGPVVHVQLRPETRVQAIRLSRDDDRYVFHSTVLPADEVTRTDDEWRRLAYRTWCRNAAVALVTFAFDDQDRLVGLLEVPVATLDDDDAIDRYLETLAKECDRFEYVLTGADRRGPAA